MGDLRPDNGGGWPPEDGDRHRGLPDFPPEWGTIVVPDDASELDAEAEELRREMRREARRDRIGRALGLASDESASETATGLGVPLVIMAVAILTTLISLFVVTWDRRADQPLPINTLPASANAPGSWVPGGAGGSATALEDLTFVDSTGLRVQLGDLLPAVILLVDGCICTELVFDTAATLPPGVRVVAVATTAPNLAGAGSAVHSLADPQGLLRSRYAQGTGPAQNSATALMVSRGGTVEDTVAAADDPDDLKTYLPHVLD